MINIALESKKDLEECDTPQMRRQIIRTIHGNWCDWLTVFQDDPDMIKNILELKNKMCEGVK